MKIKLAIMLGVLLSSFSGFAQRVASVYDPTFDFSQIKTFYVKVATPWGNPTNEQHAKQAVAAELTSKGWTEAPDAASADALVEIHGATGTKHTVHEFYPSGGEDYDGTASFATTVTFKAGSAIIDIFDTKTKKLIFRGAGEGEISEKQEKNQEKIDRGVKDMFKDFPPKQKG